MIYTLDELAERVRPVAQKHGIRHVYVFGSYARGEATEDSDVDILIDDEGVTARGFQWGGIYSDFQEAIGKDVDMLTTYTLRRPPEHRSDKVMSDRIRHEMRILYAESR